MINVLLFTLLIGYAAIGRYFFKRVKNRYLKYFVVLLFVSPTAPATYEQLKFRMLCMHMDGERIIEPVHGVESILLKGSIDTRWPNYLVESGGYSIVEVPRRYGARLEYEQYYQSEYGVRVRTVDTSVSRHQIERIQSRVDGSILENTFLATDLQTGNVLGHKKVLFLSGGPLSRFLDWKIRNNMNSGGYSCPSLSSFDDLLAFFPAELLITNPN